MGKKIALITGITGQDGSYLAELLLSKDYEVHGIVRRVAFEDSTHRLGRIQHLLSSLYLHAGSLESFPSVLKVVKDVCPDECYHLAAQSYVSYSLEDEFSTIKTNINGTHYILSAIKEYAPDCRFYYAGSSEMFGNVDISPQNEETPFYPRSAYGISKVAGFHLARNYREVYGLTASCGILYNHESPRRGFEFVTRKITSSAARIKLGREKHLRLGNLNAKRDWGHAKEYVEAMWLMLQQDLPGDWVIATGVAHTVQEVVELAFSYVGLDYHDHVTLDPHLLRPGEIHSLLGNPTKAQRELHWQPRITFQDLIVEMVENDLANLQNKN